MDWAEPRRFRSGSQRLTGRRHPATRIAEVLRISIGDCLRSTEGETLSGIGQAFDLRAVVASSYRGERDRRGRPMGMQTLQKSAGWRQGSFEFRVKQAASQTLERSRACACRPMGIRIGRSRREDGLYGVVEEMKSDDKWEPAITIDDVIRGQGADPAVIRARSPHLVAVAARALEEGMSLIQPRVLQKRFPVQALMHQKITLGGGLTLEGELVARHLASAQEVVVVVCTIGSELEEMVSESMAGDIVYGLALYGVGSAAVEALANTACRQIELAAGERGMQATIPLSPGMIGWSVEEGQSQVFRLVDGEEIGVTLNPGGVMVPLKSLSLVIGLGANLVAGGRTCDYCTMKETCRYQDHYATAG